MANIVEFFSNSNTAFLIAHCGFALFNVVNVSFLILFAWIAFGRFRQNFLLKLSFVACSIQIISCISSIHRYNIRDPHGFWGLFGAAAGMIAFVPWNIAYLYLCFNTNHRRFIRAGSVLFILIAMVDFIPLYILFDKVQFLPFQIYCAMSFLWQVVAMGFGYRAHRRKEIRIDASILSYEAMNKTFAVCIFLHILGMSLTYTRNAILYNPATGLLYTNFVILMVFVGRMDFMNQASSPIEEGGEKESSPIEEGREKDKSPVEDKAFTV